MFYFSIKNQNVNICCSFCAPKKANMFVCGRISEEPHRRVVNDDLFWWKQTWLMMQLSGNVNVLLALFVRTGPCIFVKICAIVCAFICLIFLLLQPTGHGRNRPASLWYYPPQKQKKTSTSPCRHKRGHLFLANSLPLPSASFVLSTQSKPGLKRRTDCLCVVKGCMESNQDRLRANKKTDWRLEKQTLTEKSENLKAKHC